MFRIVFWDLLPCKMIVDQIILHGSTSQKTILKIILDRRENLKSHEDNNIHFQVWSIQNSQLPSTEHEKEKEIFSLSLQQCVLHFVLFAAHSGVSITKQEVLETTNSPTFPTEDFIWIGPNLM
jgi:hypothetical protein